MCALIVVAFASESKGKCRMCAKRLAEARFSVCHCSVSSALESNRRECTAHRAVAHGRSHRRNPEKSCPGWRALATADRSSMMNKQAPLSARWGESCEALRPHLLHVALSGADPDKNVPVAIWMHRGCVPLISPTHFETIYWPTLKPIVEALWARGHQVLFYAEGNWDAHLDSFAELPDGCIVYHVDQGDIFEVHRAIGHKFCLSGGVPNHLLSYGRPDEVRDCCRKIIDGVARDGGYIMDASAIIQNDARVENLAAMTDVTREYGIY